MTPVPTVAPADDLEATLPPAEQSKAPPAQAGDPESEIAKPAAKPVLQSIDEAKAELDENPGRTSALSRDGVLVREP